MVLRNVVVELHERKTGRGGQESVKVAESVKQYYAENQPQKPIDYDAAEHRDRDRLGGTRQFFGHVCCSVIPKLGQ